MRKSIVATCLGLTFAAVGVYYFKTPALNRKVASIEPPLSELVESAKRFATTEEFLVNLPPDIRLNWVVRYSSNSLHKDDVTPTQPRYIFFSSSGKTLIAAVPGASSESGRTVEFLQADDDYRFKSATVLFASDQNEKAKVDLAPTSCHACHGTDLRPNWEPWHPFYSWPGAWGSNDDRLYNNSVERLSWDSYSRGKGKSLLSKVMPNPIAAERRDDELGASYPVMPRTVVPMNLSNEET